MAHSNASENENRLANSVDPDQEYTLFTTTCKSKNMGSLQLEKDLE